MSICFVFAGMVQRLSFVDHVSLLTLVLLNCFKLFFIHLKQELLTQFPASNDEKYFYS